MYLALSHVHPLTLAVGNTLKRVVIIAASVIAFGTPLTPLTVVGSSVAIGGVLVYSLLREYYERQR
jgi:solute carrier family 35 protein E1